MEVFLGSCFLSGVFCFVGVAIKLINSTAKHIKTNWGIYTTLETREALQIATTKASFWEQDQDNEFRKMGRVRKQSGRQLKLLGLDRKTFLRQDDSRMFQMRCQSLKCRGRKREGDALEESFPLQYNKHCTERAFSGLGQIERNYQSWAEICWLHWVVLVWVTSSE